MIKAKIFKMRQTCRGEKVEYLLVVELEVGDRDAELGVLDQS